MSELPEIEVTDRKVGFRYDGCVYYGCGIHRSQPVLYSWGDDIVDTETGWGRYTYERAPGELEGYRKLAFREFTGRHEYTVYPLNVGEWDRALAGAENVFRMEVKARGAIGKFYTEGLETSCEEYWWPHCDDGREIPAGALAVLQEEGPDIEPEPIALTEVGRAKLAASQPSPRVEGESE